MWRDCLDLILSSCEVLFPRECLVCTRPLRGSSLCFRCRPPAPILTVARCSRCFSPTPIAPGSHECSTCSTYPPPADRIRFLWDYSGTVRDLIRSMKYRPSVYLTRVAARLMTEALPLLFEEPTWDLVIPIPSSPQSLKKRAFHPCHEMARIIERSTPVGRVSHALYHSRSRTPQARRSHAERMQGLPSLFTVRSERVVTDKRVLLIEDVITTGATIGAACHALRNAGATHIDVLALSQARVWTRFRARLHRILAKGSG